MQKLHFKICMENHYSCTTFQYNSSSQCLGSSRRYAWTFMHLQESCFTGSVSAEKYSYKEDNLIHTCQCVAFCLWQIVTTICQTCRRYEKYNTCKCMRQGAVESIMFNKPTKCQSKSLCTTLPLFSLPSNTVSHKQVAQNCFTLFIIKDWARE